MKKTRILSVVAVLCLLLGMFAGAAVAEETPELKKIGVAFMKNDPFMVPLYNGMKEVCDANGIELIEYYAENDIEKQISQCDDLLQQDIDGLIVMPVDFEGITPALDAAQKAGVPVVSVDAACADAEKTIAYIASDNYKAGWLCGEHVLETLDSAKILVLSHPEIKCTIDRLQGFKDALEGHEGYEIISEQPCSGLYDKGMTIMDNWLQQYTLPIGAKDHIGLCPAVNLLKAGKHTARHAGHKGISHRRFHAVSHAFQLHARNVGQNLHP